MTASTLKPPGAEDTSIAQNGGSTNQKSPFAGLTMDVHAISPSPDSMQFPPSPTLRTSKVVHMPPLTPKTCKLLNQLESVGTSPSKRRSKLGTSRSLDSSSFWAPLADLPVPPQLSFYSWWQEQGERARVLVQFDPNTKTCTCSMQVAVEGSVVRQFTLEQLDVYDLHVGAQIKVLGKRITLRKAADLPTQMWIDQQGELLMREKARLLQELGKYRDTRAYTAQYSESQRCEHMDNAFHAHSPIGGRVNLRNLRHEVQELVDALRQHQLVLPPLKSALQPAVEGPSDWSPDRFRKVELERMRTLKLEKSMRQKHTPKIEYMEWLMGIPLAASAAGVHRQTVAKVALSDDDQSGRSAPSSPVPGSVQANNRRSSALVLNLDMYHSRPAGPTLLGGAPGGAAGPGAGAGPSPHPPALGGAQYASMSGSMRSADPVVGSPAPSSYGRSDSMSKNGGAAGNGGSGSGVSGVPRPFSPGATRLNLGSQPLTTVSEGQELQETS